MEPTGRRKLAAILMADVVDYGRHMGADEPATIRTLKSHRTVFSQHIRQRNGRVVDAKGDAIMAEFASVVDGLAAAVEIQRGIAAANAALPGPGRMQFRIGINLGDVVEEPDTLYGDGVNVAARLESLAEPGGICIARSVHDQVLGKLPLEFAYLGEHQVKTQTVRAYQVIVPEGSEMPVAASNLSGTTRPRIRLAALAAGVAVLFIVGSLGGWIGMRAPPEDPILAMPSGPAIAVLPFDNLSGDQEQEYFSDGLTEEIITELTRFRTLHVLARNSTFVYKGRSVDVREVGRELGARYVLEGSVRKAGERVRVTAQLLDAEDGRHLWAESYERELTPASVFAVQRDITQTVVSTIADIYGVIPQARLAESREVKSENRQAYECVLRAYVFVRQFSASEHSRLRDCFQQAVLDDPDYADAWAWLASMHREEYWLGLNPLPGNPLDRAEAAARRAISLDSQNQQGNLVLTQVMFFRKNLEAFFPQAERTLALNPNSNDLPGALGLIIAYAGQWDRGVALTRKAIALSPTNYPGWYHTLFCWNEYRQGNYLQALEEANRMAMPDFYVMQLALAASYGQLGRRAEAEAAAQRLLELRPNYPGEARRQLQIWFSDELTAHIIQGLRTAGLDIPAEG